VAQCSFSKCSARDRDVSTSGSRVETETGEKDTERVETETEEKDTERVETETEEKDTERVETKTGERRIWKETEKITK